ncbi:FeoB-associated Cys-rich membrane protein [Vibrio sp. 404]|uniref:FeoB-associated Cys-rich membrane protein n=1 Tax=Vibrio marinisediminis TaxID=2758441 RepID=A0A7W2ISF1_9VIBR|nr:FeoB-associated Cys-rich membrane protein [Vibrio marinisediminis]
MYEQAFSFWDITLTTLIVAGTAYYIYHKLFRKKNGCGSGCSSCPSSIKKK